jgi:hypothetical protein
MICLYLLFRWIADELYNESMIAMLENTAEGFKQCQHQRKGIDAKTESVSRA